MIRNELADLVGLDYVDRVARDLSGVEAVGLPAGSGSLPESVGLLACLDAGEDLEAAVRRWWSRPL